MADLPIRQKKPGEGRTITFDFDTKLAVGDTLTGTPTISITPSTSLTFTTPVRSGNQVTTRLSGAEEGQSYTVKCSCPTTNGDTLELSVIIEIRATVN